MRPSFYTAAALVTCALQAIALPTNERSSAKLISPEQTELSKLDERAIDWWPATACISCISTCLGAAGLQGWWYDDTKKLPVGRITTFSTCGLSCVNSGACFPAQNGVWNWQTLQMAQHNSEPAQMLLQMGQNGLFSA